VHTQDTLREAYGLGNLEGKKLDMRLNLAALALASLRSRRRRGDEPRDAWRGHAHSRCPQTVDDKDTYAGHGCTLCAAIVEITHKYDTMGLRKRLESLALYVYLTHDQFGTPVTPGCSLLAYERHQRRMGEHKDQLAEKAGKVAAEKVKAFEGELSKIVGDDVAQILARMMK